MKKIKNLLFSEKGMRMVNVLFFFFFMEQAVMILSMPLCVAHSTYKSVLKLSKQ